MRVKILSTQKESEINKELEKLEKNRNIESVFPVGKRTWILSYEDNKELENELKSLRKELDELRKLNER